MDHLRPARSLKLAVIGVCLAAAVLSGCGAERSPEAYCKAFYDRAAPLRKSFVETNKEGVNDSNFLGALVQLISAPGDLANIFDGMVDHAPDDIQAETKAVRDSFKKLQDNLGDSVTNPLGALGANLVNGMSVSGSLSKVDAYLQQHCAVNSELGQKLINEAGGGG